MKKAGGQRADIGLAKHLMRRLLIVLAVAAVVAATVAGLLLWQASDRDAAILKPDVVVYEEGVSAFSILSCDDGSITVSSIEGLEEGMVLGAGISEATPNGLLCRLGPPESIEGGFRIPTVQAALTDAIERCDITASVTMNGEGSYEITQNARKGGPFIEQAFAAGGSGNLFSVSNAFGEASAGNSIELCLEVRNGADVRFRLVDHLHISTSMNGLSGEVTLFERDLRPFKVQVGLLPVVITPDLRIDAKMEATLQGLGFQAGASLDRKVGFEYSTKDGLWVVDEDDSQQPYVEFTPEAESFGIQARGDITATLGAYLYGVVGVDLSLGLEGAIGARLKEVPEGEPADGAINVPGTDMQLQGRLDEKVTLPVSGTFVLRVPVNPFDLQGSLVELANAELFNTGDAITLLDESLRFGEVLDTYEVDLGHGLQQFAFDYPDGWQVSRLDFSYPTSGRYDFAAASAMRGGLSIDCREGVGVGISFYTTYPSGVVGGYSASTVMTEVASSSLTSRASGDAEATPFTVAKVLFRISYEESSSEVEESFYAVVPQSRLGKDDAAHWRPESAVLFPYGSWPEHPSEDLILAVRSSSLDGMSEEERQQAIEILASFRAI